MSPDPASRDRTTPNVAGLGPVTRSPAGPGPIIATNPAGPGPATNPAGPGAATLLIVEDDVPTRTFLADNLTADGYRLLVAETLRDALRALEYGAPDLALVDLGLPDGSGLDLVRRVREADGLASRLDPRLPLVILTGRTAEIDRVRGFEQGADEYVTKPFSYAELRLRLAAVLRRTHQRRSTGRLRVGGLLVDPVSREVHLRGERVAVSAKEFALLRHLATDPLRVFTKDELLRDVWGFRSPGATRTLDSHACRLRRKLGGAMVVNVWGVGYRLIDGVSHREEDGSLGGFVA